MKLPPLALALCTAALMPAHAAVIVVAPTGSTPGSIQITSDISFNITTSGAAKGFNLDEWVVSDGRQNASACNPSLAISLNGGTPGAFPGLFYDNLAGTANDVTANDGFFYLTNPIAVTAGNTLTLKARIYSLGTLIDFNPQATQTFIGNMFVVDSSGFRLSANTFVPEPSALALCSLGALALLRRRR